MKKYALLTKSGTACYETVLYEDEYNEENRRKIENQFCKGPWYADQAIAGTWEDCSENDAL